MAGRATRLAVLDALPAVLSRRADGRIALPAVEPMIPLPEEKAGEPVRAGGAREAAVGGPAREDGDGHALEMAGIGRDHLVFVALFAAVALFAVVAAVGTGDGTVAVVIGAMGIAPLLGPVRGVSAGLPGQERLIRRGPEAAGPGSCWLPRSARGWDGAGPRRAGVAAHARARRAARAGG